MQVKALDTEPCQKTINRCKISEYLRGRFPARRPPIPLCRARAGLSQEGLRTVSQPEMGDHACHSGHLLCHPVDSLGPGAEPSGSGGAARSGGTAVLLLLDRDLAA